MDVLIKPTGCDKICDRDGDPPDLTQHYVAPDDWPGRSERGHDFVALYWLPGKPVWFTAADYDAALARVGKRWETYPDTIPETTPPPGCRCYQVDDELHRQSGLLQEFRAVMERLFRARTDGKEYRRRPNLSLRLIADGEPLAKLIIMPAWRTKPERRLDPGSVTLELWTEEVVLGFTGRPLFELRQQFVCHVTAGRVHCTHRARSTPADLEQVLATARSFLADGKAVLARSRDHCCICDRELTDEVSRARGIGPECLKNMPIFHPTLSFGYGRSTIVPEPKPQTAEPVTATAEAHERDHL
jgi:hypothetical protein